MNNEREAQELFYRTYCDKMYSVCMYYAESRDEASDFLQDGFIMIFGKLHMFKFQGSLEGWVRRIIVNTALSALRKKKRFNEMFDDFENIEEVPVEVEMDEIEQIPSAKVIEVVNKLPGKAAVVLKLFAIEGFTHGEIAEIMNISIGTSKSQLNRARTLLKSALRKNG